MALKPLGLQRMNLDFGQRVIDTYNINNADVKTRGLEVHVMSNGIAYNCTGVTLKLYIRPSNHDVYESISTTVGGATGVFEVLYPEGMPGGLATGEIILSNPTETLGSFQFSVNIIKSLTSDGALADAPGAGILFSVINNENLRVAAEASRKIEFDNMIANGFIIPQNPVANFSSLATTYPAPKIGWTSKVIADGKIYRWNGTSWKWIDTITASSYDALLSQQERAGKSRISNEYAYNIDSDSFPALITGRRNRRTSYREIMVIGDSHTWGQGSADSDLAGVWVSRHIGQPYNGGFGNRIADYLSEKYDFYDSMVSFDNVGTWKGISAPYNVSSIKDYNTNTTDLNKKSDKINLLYGNLKIQSGQAIIGASVDANLFTPEARGIIETPSDMSYQTTARRQKFGAGLAYLSNESTGNYNPSNKPYIEITPNTAYTSEEGLYTVYKNSGSIYYGFLTADKTSQFIHIGTNILPDWLDAGASILVEGYGLVKVSSTTDVLGGKTIFITNSDGTSITSDISGCLYAGKKLYYYQSVNFKLTYSMEHSASKMFLSVLKNASGCKTNIYFKSPYDGGIRSIDLKDATASTAASPYHTNITEYPKVYRVYPSGIFSAVTSPEAVIANGVITIDTYSANIEDAVYIIDWGYKQKGNLVFEYGGANVNATIDGVMNSYTFLTRGFYFDGNIVKVHGFGAHTTDMLLGNAADTNRVATDHITELLQYSLTCPYLVIIQPPIVNEYLSQTPIADFTANLDTIVDKLASFRNDSYPSALYTDVLFISTVGGKVQDYSGTDTATIKYEDYYNALKKYCETNNYGYVDFRAWFMNAVDKGILDYEFIYDDEIHPSPFANEFIADELIKIMDLIM